MLAWSLRPATLADFDEPGWRAGFADWSAEQITAGPGTFVIECDDGPVGRLRLAADAAPRPLTLGVEKDNPRARALYERLGFVPDGETETEYRLRRGATA